MAVRAGKPRVDIRDVAKHAGVSVGTASNVLNEKEFVSVELAQRVRDSMKALGFIPNDNARKLKGQFSRALGMLVLSSYSSFFNSLAEAAETEADRHGYELFLAGSAQRSEREKKYLETFERQRMAGVLLVPIAGVPSAARALQSRGTPVVLLGVTGPTDFCSVAVDEELGGYLAVRHLIEQGRTRILCAGGPGHQVVKRRHGAVRAASESPGVSLMFLETPDLTVAEGERVAHELMAMRAEHRPDGVFAFNDLLAIGIINRLSVEATISIPKDMSIVGYDDIEFASMTAIPLTTVRQPVGAIASAAVTQVLTEASEGVAHSHRQELFSPTLIVRRSSVVRAS